MSGSCFKMVWDGRRQGIVLVLCLFLIIGIAVVYARTFGFDFVNYDDYGYVLRNPNVAGGLTWSSIKWALTAMYRSNWCPLVWLSFMVDVELFGLWAGGFHLVNVGLHAANTVLLFCVFRRYSGALWPSFFVAALFGLHPLHVESVAWVAERKDVLSTLFWMLTMLAYAAYVKKPGKWRYAIFIAIYAIGLMAKPMLVTLPFVLIVMDYWPLRRLWPAAPQQDGSATENIAEGVTISRLIIEKAPLIALSAASCAVTFVAQRSEGAIMSFEDFSVGQRLGNSLISYCSYILKMFWPVDLAVIYPHPGDEIAGWKIAASAMGLFAITIVAVLQRRRRYLLAGWLWYLGTLVPVIGLVQVGSQAMADRYTYVPLTGVFIMLTWLAADYVREQRRRAALVSIAGSAVIAVLGILTFRQVGHWQNTMTLFTHAAAVTRGNVIAHDILGMCYAEKGDAQGQIRQLEEIMKAIPKDAEIFYNIAKRLAMDGWTDLAIKYYNQVLEILPGDADTYGALALIQADSGDFEGAIELYHKGLEYNPQDGPLHCGLGSVLLRMGRLDEAITELEGAANLKPDSVTYVNLGLAMSEKGDASRAVEYFNKAIQLDPANAEAHYNIGNIHYSRGQLADAAGEYEKAIRANPNYIKAYGNLAVTLAQMGAIDEAINCLRHIVVLEPNNPDTHFNLARTLADKGLIDEAIENFRKVTEFSPGDTAARCKLAELLLQKRQVEQATGEYEQVLKIDPANKDAQVGLEKARAMQKAEGQLP